VLAITRPQDAPWGLAVVLCAVWIVLVLLARGAGPVRAGLVLSAIPLVFCTWLEMGLRVAGYRFDDGLIVQFGFPDPELLIRLRHDPELFWKLPYGHPGANSEGFLGSEFVIPKPSDTYRVAVLGDSCVMQGYPALVEQQLANTGGPRFEVLNFGVAGYTSHQGVVIAKRWAKKLETDVAVVNFGWNDHWQAYGEPDSQKTAPWWERFLLVVVYSSRAAQWLSSLAGTEPDKPLPIPRVSRDEYAANLEKIGELTEQAGGRVLLLTAPSSFEQLGVPGYLIPGFAADKQKPIEWHRAYNDVVRNVAKRRGWRLLDLAAEVPPDRMRELIAADGIHWSDVGLQWIAERLARAIEELARDQPHK